MPLPMVFRIKDTVAGSYLSSLSGLGLSLTATAAIGYQDAEFNNLNNYGGYGSQGFGGYYYVPWNGGPAYTLNISVNLFLNGQPHHSYPMSMNITGTESVSTPTTPTGPSSGSVSQSLTFQTGGASTTFGDPVEYQFDWGDATQSSWGATSASHSYSAAGPFNVRARARCATHTSVVSPWSGSLGVTIVDQSTRIMWVSPTSLSFGSVKIRSTAQKVFSVGNSGNSVLTVTSIGCPSGFSASPQSFTVSPGAYRNVTVTFAPTKRANYSGTISVYSDKTSGNSGVSVSGTGVLFVRSAKSAQGVTLAP